MLTINGETIDPALIDDAFLRLKSEAEAMTEEALACAQGRFGEEKSQRPV